LSNWPCTDAHHTMLLMKHTPRDVGGGRQAVNNSPRPAVGSYAKRNSCVERFACDTWRNV